jgi:hypothetical protein
MRFQAVLRGDNDDVICVEGRIVAGNSDRPSFLAASA